MHSPHLSNGNVPVGLNQAVGFKICTIFDTLSSSHVLYSVVNEGNFEFLSRVNLAVVTKTSFLPVHSLQAEVVSVAVERYVKKTTCMRLSASGRQNVLALVN